MVSLRRRYNSLYFGVYGVLRETVTKVVAHRGKMRGFLLECIAEESAVRYIQSDFFCRAAQRRKTIQVLDQYHFEQHHGIDAGPPIVPAI